MVAKPTDEELAQKINELENEIVRLKQEKAALRESEENYRTFFDDAPDLTVVIDTQGNFLDLNKKVEEESGYSRKEMIGKNAFTIGILTEASVHMSLPYFEALLAGKKWASLEVEGMTKDGNKIPYDLIAVPLRKNGKIVAVQATLRNISDRKRTEAALRESESRYSALFKGITDAVFVHHITEDGGPGRIIDINDVACKMLGYTRDELIGMGIGDIDAPESAVDVYAVVEALKAGRDVIFEQVHLAKDGGRIPVEVHAQTFDYKGRLAILSTVRNIADRKQVEEALRESEAKYRSMMEAMDDTVYICSPDFRVAYMNPAMKKRIGYNAVGEPCHKVMHGLDEKCPWCCHAGVMQGEHIKTDVVSPKNGRTYHVSNSPIFHSDGTVSKLTIFRDVTETKKMAEQLQHAQKMESIGTLAGGIAHDFNNILFPMMGFAEMALDDAPRNSPLRDKIWEILQGTKRASELVKHILAFSRQSDQKPKPLKVQLVVKEVLKLMRSSLPTTITIKHDISNECGLVMADATQIHQVVMNLMTNAYQAMEDEGGLLQVTLRNVELASDDLTDPSMIPGTYVCLTVADTGTGIEPHLLDRIFEPYFTTKENGKGTGLGLAVVHGIVKSFNGEIKVYSEPGEGTVFLVYLPAIKIQVKTEENKTNEPSPKGTERILFVDDEDMIVRLQKQMLERLGYDVTVRVSSVEALKVFQANPETFDLVITDMTMPQMTGVQLAEKMLQIRPDIPIIICTGFSTKIDNEKAKAFGIRGYVMKPVVQSELAQKIREVLEG